MKIALWLSALALSLSSVARAAAPVLPIDDFESGKGWSAVRRARVEPTADGHRGRGLKLTLSLS